MPGKALHVAMSAPAMREIHLALGRTAERLPAVLGALSDRRASPADRPEPLIGDDADRTVNNLAATPEILHFLEPGTPAGSSRRIPVHPPLTIARTAPGDLVLNAADISRSHCRILGDGENVAVSELNSTNGTFLNDRRITAPTVLKPGDRLRVGSHILVYSKQTFSTPPSSSEGTEQRRHLGAKADR